MPSQETSLDPDSKPNPYHVAIVMDGNGRWAQRQGLPRREGHRAGVDNVTRILEASQELDIRILTLYAFSAENWNRPREEVSLLMRMLKAFLEREGRELVRREVRLELAGDPSPLPREVREALDSVMEATAAFRRHALVLALNYGSRQEIVQAARALGEDRLHVVPGQHEISCQTEVFRSIRVDVSAGESRYVRLAARPGVIGYHIVPEQVEDRIGRDEIRLTRFTGN